MVGVAEAMWWGWSRSGNTAQLSWGLSLAINDRDCKIAIVKFFVTAWETHSYADSLVAFTDS